MKGYKIFNQDMACKGFKFEVGKTYEIEGELKICENGFHFCEELKGCYGYYPFNYKNPICEVESGNKIIKSGDKVVASKITILKKIELPEILEKLNLFCSGNEGSWNEGSWDKGSGNKGSWNEGSGNTGSDNKGSWNEGSGNKGSWNEGSWNEGSWNKGSDNAGSWNEGSWNKGSGNKGSCNTGSHCVGYFNAISFLGTEENCYCFNKKTGLALKKFQEKYSEIIKEIENKVFTNIRKLPNWTEKKEKLLKDYKII